MTSRPEECPFAALLPAAVQDDLDGTGWAALRVHLVECAPCRRDFATLQELRGSDIDRRRDAPFGLTARVLATARRRTFQGVRRLGARGAVVVGLVAAVALVALVERGPALSPPPLAVSEPDRQAAIEAGIAWLLRQQDHDGSWGSRRGSGLRHGIGVSSLALLALLGTGSEARDVELALGKGIAFLLRAQRDDGRVGDPGPGALYDHAPATLVLAVARRRPGGAHLEAPLARAVDRLLLAQDASGGFGYHEPPAGAPNVVIAYWAIEALHAARASGHPSLDGPLARARRWLDTLRDGDGRYGYERAGAWPYGSATTTALARRLVHQLAGRAPEAPPDLPNDWLGRAALAAVDSDAHRRGLLEFVRRQSRTGVLEGSIPAESDPFGEIAGRVYTTAMALLLATGGS